ncbi:uncharacterized protein LOC130051787 [Ostrea edulis]|uniref:uncharacterized protein LOC130051787 n=1 Tax=Ostrea edulis TaxID=37623 RepID=UPI0024AE939B|nr:uncharacterized protein LOC130051787 [Ostrea edulis]
MRGEEDEIIMCVGEEAVRRWAHAEKLSKLTTEALINMGYDSMEALSLLTADDLQEADIPVGQRRLLMHSIKGTFPLGPAASASEEIRPTPTTEPVLVRPPQSGTDSDTQTDSFIRSVLGNLTSQLNHQSALHQEATAAMNTPNTGMVSWQDPQFYLKALSSNSGPSAHFDIVDFVDNASLLQTERVLSNNEDGQLIFKSGPTKPKLENLHISQWSVANLAILQKLLGENLLAQSQILDYLSYTTRIYQLLSSHDTRSVFFYDREYRKLQNLHKFRWGTDIPHIQTVYLKPRLPQTQSSQKPSTKFQPFASQGHRASHTPQGIEICRKFNSRKGCMVRQCRFSHTCSSPGCSERHPAYEHPTKNA